MSVLSGKKVLITGAARGLGRRVAELLQARGAILLLCDRDAEALERASEALSLSGARPSWYVLDVSDRAAVEALSERILREHDAVDILVNNAGVVSGRSFLELEAEQIERTIQVNVLGLFWMTRAFLPTMVARGQGQVVTIASAAGLVGVSRLVDYSASKFAAFAFDEALRVELRRTAPGVRTTIVCPYYIDTGMFAGVKTRFPLLLPILNEAKVAARIVKAIEKKRPRLIMPPLVYTVPALRLLPVPLFDAIASALGVNVSMDEFVGRQGTRAREVG
ncbi:MAG: SDR family oxidoreductase [Myxococcota bacterium]|jgi:all-trans-retinol dehydrogenase (NAD+)|nr:SDR family oxidoreductase [Myxococcota bacterium]